MVQHLYKTNTLLGTSVWQILDGSEELSESSQAFPVLVPELSTILWHSKADKIVYNFHGQNPFQTEFFCAQSL